MGKTTRGDSEFIMLHKYGLETYEKNCDTDEYDDVYSILISGVETFAKKLKPIQ